MKRVLFLTTVMSAIALLAGGVAAQAADVPVAESFWTGQSRSSLNANQIFATGEWANGGFSISWKITKEAAGYFRYEYTIPVAGTIAPDMSHVILEVSEPFVWGDSTTYDAWGLSKTPDGQATTYSGNDPSNPFMPGQMYGLKWNTDGWSSGTISFNSWRAPVWGDFYAIDGKPKGQEVYAYNVGFGQQPEGTFDKWIARPDSRVYIPEPVFFQFGAMMGLGGLGVFRLRRR